MANSPRTDTREAIMAAATDTVRADGYNALSYRDLAAEIGIKSSSVHYHFPTKGDLAEAIVNRFRERFVEVMTPFADKPYEEAMERYLALHRSGFNGSGRICLGGMMSADISALPDSARDTLGHFVEAHKEFLQQTLAKKHPDMAEKDRRAQAAAIFAALEGAQLVVKGLGGHGELFDGIVANYRALGLIP